MARYVWDRTVVLAITALVVAGSPVSQAGPPPPSLFADTSFGVSTTPLRTTVSVPSPVTLPGSCLPAPEISVSEARTAAVVALVPQPYQIGTGAILFGRLPAEEGGNTFDNLCADRTIAAGTYTLTAVATAPSTIRLQLPGLQGTGTLWLGTTAPARFATLRQITSTTDSLGGIGRWAASGRLESQGLTAVIGWFLESAPAAQVFGDCLHTDTGVLPADVAYGPGCPTGRFSVIHTLRSEGETFFANQVANIAAGDYGLGAWYFAPAGTLRAGGALGLWLPF